MATDNLALWNSLEKTDPARTKAFTRGGGFKGTALNGTYVLKRLTETFGPCGTGWRFVLENERIEEGHTLKNGDKAKVHIVRGHLDYRKSDERVFISRGEVDDWHSTSPQFGQTMFVDENRNGVFTDEEAPKKSITDCISKCAVTLGIGADIYLGLFDDHKYVNQRQQEEREARATPPSPPPVPKPNGSGARIVPNAADRDALSEADERSLDRQSMRDMRHETSEHDPETGETGPRMLNPETTPQGTKWTLWGEKIIGAFKNASNINELSDWLTANGDYLDICEKEAPRAAASVQKAYKAIAEVLRHTTDARTLT